MNILYLGIVFLVMVVIIWMRKPLSIAMIAGMAAAVILYRIEPLTALKVLGKQTIAKETINLLLGFYCIMFLQLMMQSRGHLDGAKASFDRLFRNRRFNAMIPTIIVGLLPSAAVMTVCASMVDKTCEDYLDVKTKTFVTSFYRHIPEMFLPTFPVILLATSLTHQNLGVFILSMLPLVVIACTIVYFLCLRQLPREMPPVEGEIDKSREIRLLIGHLWPLMLVLAIIVAGNLSAAIAGTIVVLLDYVVDHFKLKEIPHLIVDAFEVRLMCNMYLIMLFKSILSYTGVLNEMPDFFGQFPISLTLSFVLMFFAGTVISGSQTIIALCMPMVMSVFPDAGIPLISMLMGTVWAAMQISPTHLCAFVAADYYKTSFSDIVAKGLLPVLMFVVICYGYGHLLMLLF